MHTITSLVLIEIGEMASKNLFRPILGWGMARKIIFQTVIYSICSPTNGGNISFIVMKCRVLARVSQNSEIQFKSTTSKNSNLDLKKSTKLQFKSRS